MEKAAETTTTRTTLAQEDAYRFRVRFDQPSMPDLLTDEPPPLGKGEGPSPGRLLAAAIGNCLASSFVFCLEKARIPLQGLDATVDVSVGRNERGRLRVQDVAVKLNPRMSAADRERVGRCLDLFESFCTVTESVRHGIDVRVSVEPTVEG